jgi:hypothetical protein
MPTSGRPTSRTQYAPEKPLLEALEPAVMKHPDEVLGPRILEARSPKSEPAAIRALLDF